jgi:predicted dehydrogenase
MIVYDDLEASEKVKVYDKGLKMGEQGDARYQVLVGYRAGDMWAPQIEVTEALQTEALHFLECITQQRHSLTDGEAGLRVVRILEAATRSMSCRGQVVELDRPTVAA